ncbi:MAG: hypothetical protein M3081_19220 [Gemmatimonadota bacterium]|nr:hypothetical protein [Gemmatimonadota bacterium]
MEIAGAPSGVVDHRLRVPSSRWPARAIVIAALLIPFLVLLVYSDFIPMWDGRVYANCIVYTAIGKIGALRCANHPGLAYIGIHAIVQSVAPYSRPLMLAVDCALATLGLFAFYRILLRCFPGEDRALERALVLLALSVNPVLLANIVQPNLDLGVVVFFLCCLWAVVEERVVPLAIAGTLLVFSKETGMMLYGLLGGLYGLMMILRAPMSRTEKVAKIRRWLPALLPLLLFVLYLLAVTMIEMPALWASPDVETARPSVLDQFLTIRLLDPVFLVYVALIFVINFLWVPSVVIAIDALIGAARFAVAAPRRAVAGADATWAPFLTVLTLLSVIAGTRYLTYANARYMLPLYPLLLIAFYLATLRSMPSRRARLAVLTIVPALLAWSIVRSDDPISRRFFGTFDGGSRPFLHMTSRTNECCGLGRDQLAYNLQFVALGRVQRDAFADIRPTGSTVIVMHPVTNWFTSLQLDSRTYAPTLHNANAFRPYYRLPEWVLHRPPAPALIYYLAFPFARNDSSLTALRARYDDVRTTQYERGGVRLTVYCMRLREVPAADVEPCATSPERVTAQRP